MLLMSPPAGGAPSASTPQRFAPPPGWGRVSPAAVMFAMFSWRPHGSLVWDPIILPLGQQGLCLGPVSAVAPSHAPPTAPKMLGDGSCCAVVTRAPTTFLTSHKVHDALSSRDKTAEAGAHTLGMLSSLPRGEVGASIPHAAQQPAPTTLQHPAVLAWQHPSRC